MSFEEIGDTTPNELNELIDQYVQVVDQENSRFGQICATLANLKRDPQKHDPFTPSHFFPTLAKVQEDEEEFEGVNEEEVIGAVLDAFAVDTRTRLKMNGQKGT